MKILDSKQIRALDAYTISHEPVASIDLMERASRAFVDWFTLHVGVTSKVAVVCGTGNNGGDGLAIARMLHEWGYPVAVLVVGRGAGETPDFTTNLSRLPPKVQVALISDDVVPEFKDTDVIVDALFGTGLSRPPAGLYARVIDRMNSASALRIAVDIPSGLMPDVTSSGTIVRAHHTITFQMPKLSFFLPQSYAFTGEWVVVDIGLDKDFIRNATSLNHYTRLKDVHRMLKARGKFDHKGTFGHALLIAGSYGKMGACILAARAALRSGLGLLSACVPACGYVIMQTAVPEAMVLVDKEDKVFATPPDTGPYDVIGVGPGLGQDKETVKALAQLLENAGKPMVLDADALNILGSHRHLMGLIPPGSILTPHPREFERLTQASGDDFERMTVQKQLAVSLNCHVVLKGAYTAVATPDGKFYFNSTGNPGMATGGTGDVLTGVLTGLLAQKYTPTEAAVMGVFIHGLAGDLAVSGYGMESMTASDLVDSLAAAFLKVRRNK